MAQNQDKDDAGAGKPKPVIPTTPATSRPDKAGPAPRTPAPEAFLPEDSFLLDVEDDKAQPTTPTPTAEAKLPAPGGGEEWLLVDDSELGAPDGATTEPLPLGEPVAAEPVEAAPAPSDKKVPSWYTDEGALPTFVAEGDEAAAASLAESSEAAAAEPVAPTDEAPVLDLASARRRRALVAAAAMLALLGIGGAVWFQMNRGSGDGERNEVASAPRTTVKPTPKPEPAPVVSAPEPTPEPTPVEPAPIVEAPPVEPAPTLTHPDVAPAPSEPVVLEEPRKRPLPAFGSTRSSGAATKKSDTIVQLKNGHTFRGQITRTKGTLMTMRIGLGDCVFDLSEVTLLDSSAPDYRRADQMPEASVVLTTGQRLRGRLMKQTEENVVLVVENGQVVFPRADIRDVNFTGRIHF